MSSTSKAQATLKDKLCLVVAVVGVWFEAIFVALRYLCIPSSKSQPSVGREVTRVLLRALHDLDRFSAAQLRWALPSTTVAYTTWLKTNAVAEDIPAHEFTEPVGHEGTKLYWVGHKDAKKVILYYHGGGYVLPLSNFHLNFTNYLRKEVKRKSGLDVKIAFLDYAFAPEYIYPTQFREATLALQHVLDSGISPKDIIIAGDSVGGQLALQVLSHILHPHPAIPRIHAPAVPFAALLAISPWVVYESDAPSYMQKNKDILPQATIATLADVMRGTICEEVKGEPEGFWREPLVAPTEWWHSTARAVRNVLMVYGSQELFTEDNALLAKKMREGTIGTGVGIKDIEEPFGLHVGPLIDAFLRRPPSETSKAIAEWLNTCLTSKYA